MRYILSLDQGTTSSRAILFDHDGAVRSVAQREFSQIFPQPGWVEHDPEEIASSQIAVALEALAQGHAQRRATSPPSASPTSARPPSSGIAQTGKPIHNAIVWQDRRTAAFCDQLKAQGHEKLIQQRTGLLIDAYFSGSKISWILDHVPDARQLRRSRPPGIRHRRYLAGLEADWRPACTCTDASNASRTMLFNIHAGRWDDDLLNLFRASRARCCRRSVHPAKSTAR